MVGVHKLLQPLPAQVPQAPQLTLPVFQAHLSPECNLFHLLRAQSVAYIRLSPPPPPPPLPLPMTGVGAGVFAPLLNAVRHCLEEGLQLVHADYASGLD